MALARVVSFEGVGKEQIVEMQRQMSEEDQPADIPATEVIVLHDGDSEKSLAILFLRPRTTTSARTRCSTRCRRPIHPVGGRRSRSTTSQFARPPDGGARQG